MVKAIFIAVAAIILANAASGEDFAPLHTIYATPGNQGGFARSKLYYIATLCGGEAFDGQRANVTLNMPTHDWDVQKGYYLKVHATNSKAKALGDNNATSGDPHFLTQSLDFIYHHTDGDIYFEVQVGPGSGYHVFTFSMSFENVKSTTFEYATRHVVSSGEARIRESRDRYLHEFETNVAGKKINYIQLLQLFKIQGQGTVKTTELAKYRMDYCFQPATTRAYNISVTVIAMDGKSAFGLYVCPASVSECTVPAAPIYDDAGTAACFAHVSVNQRDYGVMRAIVQGDGRHNDDNTFVITASGYKPV